MKLLIIGGTRFVGRHLVEAALRHGHTITLFNRGQSGPQLFHELERIMGDRAQDIEALSGRRWDAVIDTCGYLPRIVRLSTEALVDSVSHYTFISTISVYADFSKPGVNESSRLASIQNPDIEEVNGETYGPLKVLCEAVVEESFQGRALIVRPGLIVGPHDPTDRFTYWPVRIARGGEVLAPDRPDLHTQFIDGRDLAEWTVSMVETRQTGIYNAIGPREPLTLGQLFDTCQAVSQSDARFTWVNGDFLVANGAEPWSEIPLWIHDEEYAGADQVDISLALGVGLILRPISKTIRDTLEWAASRPADYQWRVGLSAEKEKNMLNAWKNRTA